MEAKAIRKGCENVPKDVVSACRATTAAHLRIVIAKRTGVRLNAEMGQMEVLAATRLEPDAGTRSMSENA